MPNLTPEQRARETIDAMLGASGWSVQAKDAVNLSAACGVAVSERSFATGAPDYTLFVGCKAIGTVEAKPEGVNQRGGLGRAYQLFGDQLPALLEELNGVLVA